MAFQIIQDSEEFENRLDTKFAKLKSSLLAEITKEFQPKQPEEYLTRAEVCSLLKISYPTLDRYVEQGHLKKYSIIGKVFFKRSEIEESLILLE